MAVASPFETAARFALGVLAAIGLSVALSTLFSTWRIGPVTLAIPFIAFAAGGAIAGHALGVGTRAVVGFAFAFPLTLPVLVYSMIGLQGLGTRQSFESLGSYFGLMGAVSFGIMGLVGTGIAGLRRDVVASSVVFGAGGLLGGILLAASLAMTRGPSGALDSVILWTGLLLYFALPPIFGGWFLGRRRASAEFEEGRKGEG